MGLTNFEKGLDKEIFLFFIYINVYTILVNSKEFKRWLAKQGCTFEPKHGGGGHLVVKLGDKKADLPMHSTDLKKGLVEGIKKRLGLK